MSIQQLHDDFRNRFPQIADAADAKHTEAWPSPDPEVTILWFESLAKALNDRMGATSQDAQTGEIFRYFATKYRTGNDHVKSCIDTGLIENLFWQVPSRRAAPVWPLLPTELQKLYIDFHGQPPKLA